MYYYSMNFLKLTLSLLFSAFTLLGQGQVEIDGGFLRIGPNTKSEDLDEIELDSVLHVCFTKSKISSLDSTWSRLKNVKLITFSDHSIIPKNLDIIGNCKSISFSKYHTVIHFPSDFPYERWTSLTISGVIEIPREMARFRAVEVLFLYSVLNGPSCSVIGNMKKLNQLVISEVKSLDIAPFCNLPLLNQLELSMLTFKNTFVDFGCFKSLKLLDVDSTNMTTCEVHFNRELSVRLVDNQLKEEEVLRIQKEAKDSNLIIKN